MTESFDVFLSHNSRDKPAVRELAESLRARGLKVWLDEWELVPGRRWQKALEEAIETTRAAAVLVGKDGFGPWQEQEMEGCLSEFVQRKLPVIPVLLPGAPEAPKLPFFLRGLTWVDLRSGLTEKGLDQLQWGITGRKPPEGRKRSSIPIEVPKARPASPERRPAPLEGAAPAAVKPRPSSASWTIRQVPRRSWYLRLLPLLLATGTLAAVVALGMLLAQRLTALPAVEAVCVPGEERIEDEIIYVRICPGTFTMGSPDDHSQGGDDDEKPAHQVTLSEFLIGKTEITNDQYRRFRPGHQGQDGLPATNVSWSDAQAACEQFGGRLPTEAEWEYAARAGSRTAWAFGDDEKGLGEHAWYKGNSNDVPHSVGKQKPNAWGLHDMHGNVLEWVADWYGPYLSEVQTDPLGPSTGTFRVVRGGSYLDWDSFLRSADRLWVEPESSDRHFGFRCARSPRRQTWPFSILGS